MKRQYSSLILFLCIILFSGLGVSAYKETLETPTPTQGNCMVGGNCIVKKDTVIHQNPLQENPNYFYVLLFLVVLIVWLLLIKQNNE